MKVYEQMKWQGRVTMEIPHQILLNSIGIVIPAAAASLLPEKPTVRRTLQKQRQMAGNSLPFPVSTKKLIILPDLYKTTLDENAFSTELWNRQNRKLG